jgi:hypothetical protein
MAHPTIEVGSDTAGVPYPSLAINDHDAIVFAERRKLFGVFNLSLQQHLLQLPQGPLEDLAPPTMPLVLNEVGLNAESTQHLPFSVADGMNLL